jgi:hypothetical protein
MAVPALLLLGVLAFLSSRSPAFVPPPSIRGPKSLCSKVAASSAVPALLAAAPAAFADGIADASKKFSDAAYPVAQKFNWGGSSEFAKYIAEESAKNPKGTAKAVEKLLEAGLTMDPKLVYAAVQAHDKALDSAVSNPNLVASKADFAAVNEALARMIASADKEQFFYLLSSFPENKELQMKFLAGNNLGDAQAAYGAFVGLTDAVRAASTNGAGAPVVAAASGGPIGDAAAKFSDATYPIMQKIDWGNTPLISKYIAEASATNPKMMAAAFDKTLEVGLSMDPKLVAAAVAAHAKAIEGAVGNPGLVASKADFAAVNEALARMIGSADPAKFKAILTAFPGNADLQMSLFAANNAGDAQAAYETFVALTNAVKR